LPLTPASRSGLLLSGWDVMLSDADVVWLDSPWPWIGPKGWTGTLLPEAAKMAKADLLVSTDVVELQPGSASALQDREYSTGMAFWRANQRSLELLRLWRERLDVEAAPPGLYVHDQAVFNRLTHGNTTAPLLLNATEAPDLSPEAVRGVFWVTSPPMAALNTSVLLGTLPQARFCGGDSFFVSRLPDRFGMRPVAVHATSLLGQENTSSFGKRHLLRQAQAWGVDADDYFADGSFLTISGDVLLADIPLSRDQHARIEAVQRERLYDALSLAHALNRTLVLPHLTCLAPGADSTPLLAHCPLDHLFELGRWHEAGLLFREAGFLSNPRVPAAVLGSRAVLRFGALRRPGGRDAPEYDDGQPAAAEVAVDVGLSFEKLSAAVAAAAGAARVLEVDARDLGALCGFEDGGMAQDVDGRLQAAFAPSDVKLCAGGDNDGAEEAVPLNCTRGVDAPESLGLRAPRRDACTNR
jgi:hypothetical protein